MTRFVLSAKSVNVFPNPTGNRQEFNVVVNATESDLEQAKLSISSLKGQIVIQNSHVQQLMKIGGLPKGVYIINVQFLNGESLNKKLMVE